MAFDIEREIILRPDNGSQTLLVPLPNRDPEPAASTTIAMRSMDKLWQIDGRLILMGFSLFWPWRKRKIDPAIQAADIVAKFEAKRATPKLFTEAQEVLMDELGLTPGSQRKENAKKRTDRANDKSDLANLAASEAERLKKIHSTRRDRK